MICRVFQRCRSTASSEKTLTSLINASIPILPDLADRIILSVELPPKSIYPIHISTEAELTLFSRSFLLKSKNRLCILSTPFQSSELYLHYVAKRFASQQNSAFLSLENNDLFHRINPASVIESYPLVNGVKSRNGFGRKPPRAPPPMMAMFAGAAHIQIRDSDESTDDCFDTPNVPYPWFNQYTMDGSPQQVLATRPNFVLTEHYDLVYQAFSKFFEELKEVQDKMQIELLTVFYKDFVRLLNSLGTENSFKDFLNLFIKAFNESRIDPKSIVFIISSIGTSTLSQPKEPQENMLHNMLEQIDVQRTTNNGRDRRKSKKNIFQTPFSSFIGIDVYPPSQNDIVAHDKFLVQMKKDGHRMNIANNLSEVAFAAKHAGIILPPRFALDVSSHDSYSGIPAVRECVNKPDFYVDLIGSSDAERIVSLIYGSYLMDGNTGPAAEIDFPVSVDVHHVVKGLETFIASKNTFEKTRTEILSDAHIFKNVDDINTLSKHEKNILSTCLIKPSSLNTSFSKIGGLKKTKDQINELIRLPLLRPEVFTGVLKQSTSGLLLFGPPGTGKTMLARAVAMDSGANFLNVQMSSVSSMWVGENEKNVAALFSLARKINPCVVFVDEIDAMLKFRQQSSPHHVTNTINEFMASWDGMLSESGSGVIVVGATNRPYDLDDAVLRRLPRRIMVDLPMEEERAEILRILLVEEEVSDRDSCISYVVGRTQNFSGSDLKNLAIAAALTAVREQNVYGLDRIMTQKHFESSLDNGDIVPSFNAETNKLLKKWNEKFGTSKKKSGADDWGF